MQLLFFKSTSRTINNQDDDDLEYANDHHELQEEDSSKKCTFLTVWRKSLVFSCKGFTVIGSDGSLVYRVDNYSGRPGQIILMDGLGHPLLTIFRRKKMGLVDNWLIFEGEVDEHYKNSNKKKKKINNITKDPMFVVRKNMNILQGKQSNNILAYVYKGNCNNNKRHNYSYVIEGSYANRSCKILDGSRRRVVLAEIKKKEAMVGGSNSGGNISFGLEVFLLIVHPGFDSGFAMSLILLLDQMFS